MRSLGNSVDNYLRVIIGAVAFLLFAKYEYNAVLAIAFEVILVIISAIAYFYTLFTVKLMFYL